MKKPGPRLIETDGFPFEFLSALGKRESWRKEVHRPIYHLHKWWAKRLGSLFRGLALGSVLGRGSDLRKAFYRSHDFSGSVVLDPFMGSGTTVGEAHKLGFTALGRDINPVAVEAVRVALGELDISRLEESFETLSRTVGVRIRQLYQTVDSRGEEAQTLYYFWVMQAACPACEEAVDLFSSWVRAQNAYARRKPGVQVLCPSCGDFFAGLYTDRETTCTSCGHRFDQTRGTTRRTTATCTSCDHEFAVKAAASPQGARPRFRLHGKLVLTRDGQKEYLAATEADHRAYRACGEKLQQELQRETFKLPTLALQDGHNTRQAMSHGFRQWRDFFNPRQLLALGWLQEAIAALPRQQGRDALLTLFSGVLEFNNMFASYKGEGTGAVRHMFSHHILKPERTPIEANVWGTPRSSGSFSGLFRTRLSRAVGYRQAPTELKGADNGGAKEVCSPAFTGTTRRWVRDGEYDKRAIYLSCGDSANTGLAAESVDLVLTDPPFFDNVHYSELADFFYAWQQLTPRGFIRGATTTRSDREVQDTDAERFASKLESVFRECHRVLRPRGLLVFTYHHSREQGWSAVARAVLEAGFVVVNSHPLKAEMSVATPKSQATEPIQLDIAIVCRKASTASSRGPSRSAAIGAAEKKLARLEAAGFALSRNDQRVVLFGQLLTTLRSTADLDTLASGAELAGTPVQLSLF